jgi:hypothetical protein
VQQAAPETDIFASLPSVHTNASGDFFLMSRERWHGLRAYPELYTSSYIDGYMVFIAAFAGLKQRVLPFPIFHQEHDRSERAGRPMTELERIPTLRTMLEKDELIITNHDNWGLRDFDLPISAVSK